jgi:hypothetical protein
VACHNRSLIAGGDPEEVVLVDGPNDPLTPPGNERIWKAQAFICEGNGTVRFLEQRCICDCSSEPSACDSAPCLNENFVPFSDDYNLDGDPDFCPPPTGHVDGVLFGKQHAKVMLTNPCPTPRNIRYWWKYRSDGVQRLVTSGVTVPGSSSIRLCFTALLYRDGDHIWEFAAFQWPDCPGQFDSVPGGCVEPIIIEAVRDACCPIGGPCVERIPNPPPGGTLPCVP